MMTDHDVVRRFARDHWVRAHGTPRLTVLVGAERARALWSRWATVAAVDSTLIEPTNDLDADIQRALDETHRNGMRAVALLTDEGKLSRWRVRANDRSRTLVDEGCIVIPERVELPTAHRATPAAAADTLDARSIAEAILFEALEATPATKGRFELNGYLSVRFGGDAAEVDLLDRKDRIAVEIDGYHHFTDADAYRRDRRKDVLLQSQGLFVIRLLAEDVMRDPTEAVNVVCRALAFRLENP